MPDIAFWNKCNNKCVMCTNMDSFVRQKKDMYGLKFHIARLNRYLAGEKGIYVKNPQRRDYINLTGGEPTMHPDFFPLLYYFRKKTAGLNITLLTNGRIFSDRKFAEKFLKIAHPPFTVAAAVHGSNAAVHDGITGVSGSFRETMKGLEHLFLMRGGHGIEIRIVLHKMNIKNFGAILKMLLRKFPETAGYRIVAIHYEIEGRSIKNQKIVRLSLAESCVEVGKAADTIKKFLEFRLYHFPLCMVQKSLRKLCWITLPEKERIYPGKCLKCVLKKNCVGLMREYYKKFGDSEITAVNSD
ncbi:MAG: radical SAM protein [Elusimicrobia bacterium]|nr:radical SAM protein [Elusimicrobiota bacterium]